MPYQKYQGPPIVVRFNIFHCTVLLAALLEICHHFKDGHFEHDRNLSRTILHSFVSIPDHQFFVEWISQIEIVLL